MLERLEHLVRKTGARIRGLKNTAALRGEWDGSQLKTEADLIAHHCFVEGIKAVDPALPVVSEENVDGQCVERPGRYFLIDPIDGTASLAGGFPGWTCQVALMNGGKLNLGENPAQCILIDNYPEPQGSAISVMEHLNCTGYLECGGISLKILRIADETADVFFKDVVVRDWDLAAPHLVLEEAGAVMRLINGSPMIYGGSFDKPGVVAARSLDTVETVVQWWRGQRKTKA